MATLKNGVPKKTTFNVDLKLLAEFLATFTQAFKFGVAFISHIG